MMAKRLFPSIVLLLFLLLAAGASLADLPKPPPDLRAFAPPGTSDPDPGPSSVIYPPQVIPIRMDHKKHVKDLGVPCIQCHTAAKTSHLGSDDLLPKGVSCDGCHGTDHKLSETGSVVATVTRGDLPIGECKTCHEGGADPLHPPAVIMPSPNLKFDHEKHASRNIGCANCHGAVEELGLATRDQLPRMRGCLHCHDATDSDSQGDAKSDCLTCHLERIKGVPQSEMAKTQAVGVGNVRADATDGRMQTLFPNGMLTPPNWLRNAAHTPDFMERHKTVAGNDSSFCANCHSENYCTACHDGKIRPRNIHPGDYLSLHAADARLSAEKCTSCHSETSFCLTCHQRLGVAMTSPSAYKDNGRFHPPRSVWSDMPKKAGHHAFEAKSNLSQCVSCHIERDCVVCHGGKGIGGGFSPHPADFLADCPRQMRKNGRPCLVCHDLGDSALQKCR